MPYLDRSKLHLRPLSSRANRVTLDHFVDPDAMPGALGSEDQRTLERVAERIRASRAQGRSVVLAFGAHTIKNGLAPVLVRLMDGGWITHLATNGAGIIHDWEFAYQGESSEDVRANMEEGAFGLWEETGLYLNLALAVGAYEGSGYGESIGRMIDRQGLDLPDPQALRAEPDSARKAAALDLAEVLDRTGLGGKWLPIPHRCPEASVQRAALARRVPFTGHPMFGQDIVYCHPACSGAAIGRTAERDFLSFAHSVAGLDEGVYLSIGSAVMSPMIFEKAFSMAQNLALGEGREPMHPFIAVVDLARSGWDWQTQGEPPPSDPAYYLRFMKTFSRVGAETAYLGIDNRDFLLGLAHLLG